MTTPTPEATTTQRLPYDVPFPAHVTYAHATRAQEESRMSQEVVQPTTTQTIDAAAQTLDSTPKPGALDELFGMRLPSRVLHADSPAATPSVNMSALHLFPKTELDKALARIQGSQASQEEQKTLTRFIGGVSNYVALVGTAQGRMASLIPA